MLDRTGPSVLHHVHGDVDTISLCSTSLEKASRLIVRAKRSENIAVVSRVFTRPVVGFFADLEGRGIRLVSSVKRARRPFQDPVASTNSASSVLASAVSGSSAASTPAASGDPAVPSVNRIPFTSI